MAGKPQTLSDGQKKQVCEIFGRRILSATLIILALLGGIFGASLWGIYSRINDNLENLIAKQFEEDRIKDTLSSVAETKAEVILVEQITPEVEKFKAEINSQLDEIRKIVASIEEFKSNSASNAKQIERVLSSVQKSEQEIEGFKKAISSLQSDLIKINRGLVEIQYFSVKGANRIPNPYGERIQKTLNDIISIAVPDPKERSKFVQELNSYKSE